MKVQLKLPFNESVARKLEDEYISYKQTRYIMIVNPRSIYSNGEHILYQIPYALIGRDFKVTIDCAETGQWKKKAIWDSVSSTGKVVCSEDGKPFKPYYIGPTKQGNVLQNALIQVDEPVGVVEVTVTLPFEDLSVILVNTRHDENQIWLFEECIYKGPLLMFPEKLYRYFEAIDAAVMIARTVEGTEPVFVRI